MIYIGLNDTANAVRNTLLDLADSMDETDVDLRDTVLRRFAERRDNPCGIAVQVMRAFSQTYGYPERAWCALALPEYMATVNEALAIARETGDNKR